MKYTLKKSLGQHFLHDETVCIQIVEALQANNNHVLEIGPGAGAITKYLLRKPFEKYVCVELDEEKVAYLKHIYPLIDGKIIHQDFLQMPMPFEHNFSIIGNFPYNISSQIMFKVLDWKEPIDEVVGMFQKEVAQRIASKHGNKDYGILSVLIQCYFNVAYLFDVPAHCFTPPPKVVSGVIRLEKKENPLLASQHYEKFKTFVKACFNQRRKTLRNGLKSYLPPEKLQDDIFNKRAEQLSVMEFVDLFILLYHS